MFGHKWEPAEGVIAETRTEQVVTGEHQHGGHVPHQAHVYVIDVRTAAGSAFRATVPAPAGVRHQLAPGTRVHLEVNAKTNEVRFDPSHPVDRGGQVESLREAVHRARDLRREMTGEHHGAGAAGAAGAAGGAAAFIGLAQAAAAGRMAERLGAAGPHGAALAGGPEVAELMQSLMSGGPGREAAIARLKELAQGRVAQGGGAAGPQIFVSSQTHPATGGEQQQIVTNPEPEGFSSGGPAGFEAVTPTPPVLPVIPPPASRPSAFGEEIEF
jgi:hypothetical protein